MKKILLSLAVAVMLCGTAAAQGFGWGAKAGINLSNMSNSDGNTKVGLTAGLFADYKFSPVFAISADVLYANLGTQDKSGGVTLKIVEHYVNIPILFNAYITEGLAVKAGI